MNKILLLFLIGLISLTKGIIIDAVYNIRFDDKYYISYKNKKLSTAKSNKFEDTYNFRINKIFNNSFYYIEHVISDTQLSGAPNQNLKLFPQNNMEDSYSSEWTFIEREDNKYIIQNINKCYIVFEFNNLKCRNVDINKAKNFNLIKIYEEVRHSKEDLELIEKEPIDVFIKYIDLSDPFLKREGIPQIKKDENNQELKYSIRSILKNIPWVRKIYILMPNEKVKFLKEYDYIKEKIVYVKDKDVLGFDSANSRAFQFSLPKMKKFNISDNFIIMDDDYFIGQKLNKSDFFYVENGTVVPSIISNTFQYQDMDSAKKGKNQNKRNAEKVKGQTSAFFMHAVFTTYLYIMEIFNKTSLMIPYFTHNAIPVNINDLTEIYNIVNEGKYRESTLESLNRQLESLQFHTFVMTYTFNKYYKKIHSIPYNYIDNNDAIKGNYNYPLFCINTGAKDYSVLSFNKTRIAMEKNFPEPTKYEENFDFSLIPELSFNIINEMENELKKSQDEQKKLKDAKQKLEKELQLTKSEINNRNINYNNYNNNNNNNNNNKEKNEAIIRTLNTEIQNYKKENDKIKNENNKIKKENELLKSELSKLQNETEIIKNDNNNTKKENELFKLELSKLQNESEIIKNDNNNIKKENELLKLELIKLQNLSSNLEIIKNDLIEKEIIFKNINDKAELKEDFYINIIADLKQKVNDKEARINNLEFEKNKLIAISNIYFIIIEIIILLLILFYIFNKIKNALKKIKDNIKKDNEINKEKKGKDSSIEIEMENIGK